MGILITAENVLFNKFISHMVSYLFTYNTLKGWT